MDNIFKLVIFLAIFVSIFLAAMINRLIRFKEYPRAGTRTIYMLYTCTLIIVASMLSHAAEFPVPGRGKSNL